MDSSGNQTGAENQPPSTGAASPEQATAASQPEDLPDDSIPLTPELVEEDAQRNDFVLRLTVVLLALLLGMTEIGESQTLVHVRSGQYQATHGVLPPRADVFSYTAGDRPWVNLSWLFDLIVAGVYGVGGGFGLTLFKACLAGLTFGYVVHTNRAGVSTWWGSVCAALALLVCFPQLTALPELITLLGVAVVLWLLNRWEQGGSRRNLWFVLATIAIWSNLDPRAFVGVMLVVLFAAGSLIDRLLGRGAARDGGRDGVLAIAAVGAVIASMLNPFFWQSLLAPVSLYANEYPAWRSYHQFVSSVKHLEAYRLIDRTYWSAFAASGIVRLMVIAGLSLAAAALVTMVLNWRRLRLGHSAVFFGFTALAILGVHELAVASIVWCVLANLNAQEWYRHSFRQTYSTNFSERLFSTGGRFVSVFALLAVAWLAVSGELAGLEGNRIGFGFRQTLRAEIDGLTDDIADVPRDYRLFNTAPEQGDLMIWVGHPPFIDSRLGLYAGRGERDVLSQHVQARGALRPFTASIPHSGDRRIWQDVFEAHAVDGVLVHLAGRYPPYELYWELRSKEDFRLAELGSAAAVIDWTGSSRESGSDSELTSQVDMLAAAFHPESPPEIPTRYDMAQPRSFYDRLFNLPRSRRSIPFQKARHYDSHISLYGRAAAAGGLTQADLVEGLALAHLAIRHVHIELADNPQVAECYRILGHAYEFLGGIERIPAGGDGLDRRYLEAVNAYRQAVVIEPGDYETWQRLRNLFLQHGKLDLVLEAQRHVDANLPDLSGLSAAEQRALANERRQIKEVIKGVDGEVRAVTAQVERALNENDTQSEAVRVAFQGGCILRALELIETVDEEQRFGDPTIRLFEARLRLEAGHGQQASEILAELEETLAGTEMYRWRSLAALAAVVRGDFPHAVALWEAEAQWVEDMRFDMLFGTLPLAAPHREAFRTDLLTGWPVDHLSALQRAWALLPAQRSAALLNAALTRLETGQADEASELFERLIAGDPNTTLRPLVRLYHQHASGSKEPIDAYSPMDRIPLSAEVFASPDGAASPPAEAPQPAESLPADANPGDPP